MAAAQQVVPVFNLSFPPSIQLPKLDGTNWQQWSTTLGALMRMNGTHCHLTHAAPVHADPANPDAAIVVRWDKEEVLTSLLFLFVTSEVYSQIASDLVFATVHAKYQQLETLYGAVGSMATFNLWVSLANTKLQEGSPFLPQLQHMLDMRNTLGENGMAISDMQMSFILLDALPPSYSTIAGTILTAGLPSALSPQDLINRFINEESRISSPGAALNKAAPFKSTTSQSHQPHAPSAPQGTLSSSASKDVTCYYCKKAGHKLPDCHKKKKDLENVKKGKAGQQRKAAQNTAKVADNTMDAQTLSRLASAPPIGKSTLQSRNLYTVINGSRKIEEVLDAPQVSLYTMSGNTQKPVAWMMDSGASQHFTPYIEDFTTYTQHKGVEISLGDNSIIKSTSVGSVTIRTNRGYDLILSDLLHVPQTHSRILSTSALTMLRFRTQPLLCSPISDITTIFPCRLIFLTV